MLARTSIRVASDVDIVSGREAGRRLARDVGFAGVDLVLIATAISEVARNIVSYAGEGELELTAVEAGHRKGIEIVARDHGPGIKDVEMAMQEGYSTGGGLGMGLPGSRRLMHEFAIESAPGQGTTVIMRKWLT
jgi:serine/threonine-protein kinase RsbT